MAGKIQPIDYRDGGLEVFKIIAIYLQDGKITPEQLAHEKASWEANQYQAVTEKTLDLQTAQRATAQLRELRKEQETILANDEKLIVSHAKLSAIYHPKG